MIGGGGRKVLMLAGEKADIVSINFNNRLRRGVIGTGSFGQASWTVIVNCSRTGMSFFRVSQFVDKGKSPVTWGESALASELKGFASSPMQGDGCGPLVANATLFGRSVEPLRSTNSDRDEPPRAPESFDGLNRWLIRQVKNHSNICCKPLSQ